MSNNEPNFDSVESDAEQEELVLKSNFEYFNKFFDLVERKGLHNLSNNAQDQMKCLKNKMNSIIGDAVAEPIAGPSSRSTPVKERKIINNKDSKDKHKIGFKSINMPANDEILSELNISSVTPPQGNSGGFEVLAKAMAKLDSRCVPDLKKFSDDNNQDLIKYLERFETYCKDRIKPNEMYWLDELESHLEGRVLLAFESIREEDDSYLDVKNK